ncbi:hypothetical protein DRJ17_01310 [Candidatus Woesearchaeota archaeon]|nr:MAG: hypothetical protein DRJ17_01310 [Candidatus Woesearchaeota archaeon]
MEKEEIEIKFTKQPKNPILIEGFPGFGLIGTIATEFLINHLKTELIGKYWIEELPATIAIHKGKVISPIEFHYCEKHNLLIVHAITAIVGTEWHLADIVLEVAKKFNAKELISLEGVSSIKPEDEAKVFYFSNQEKKDVNIEKLEESIIMGVTAALFMKADIPFIAFFAETHSQLPDSKAAAKIVEAINDYLGLKIDVAPLIKMAEELELKLNKIIEQSKKAVAARKEKELSYVG